MRSQQEDNRTSSGYILPLTSALILSTSGIVVRYLTVTYHIPPMILAFWYNFFISICLLFILELYYPFLMEIRRRDVSYLVAYGFLLAVSVFNILWTTSAGFAVLLSWWFFDTGRHENLNPWTTLLYSFGFASLFLLVFNLLA